MWNFSEEVEGKEQFFLLIFYVYILKEFMWKMCWQWNILKLKCIITFFCMWTLLNKIVRIIFHLDRTSEH